MDDLLSDATEDENLGNTLKGNTPKKGKPQSSSIRQPAGGKAASVQDLKTDLGLDDDDDSIDLGASIDSAPSSPTGYMPSWGPSRGKPSSVQEKSYSVPANASSASPTVRSGDSKKRPQLHIHRHAIPLRRLLLLQCQKQMGPLMRYVCLHSVIIINISTAATAAAPAAAATRLSSCSRRAFCICCEFC